MTKLWAYDVDVEIINKIAEENDTDTGAVIYTLLEAVNDNGIDIKEYL